MASPSSFALAWSIAPRSEIEGYRFGNAEDLVQPGHFRNGCSALWPKQSCRWSVLRRGTCRRC